MNNNSSLYLRVKWATIVNRVFILYSIGTSTLFTAFIFNLGHSMGCIKQRCEGEGHRKRPWPPHNTRPSADGVNPPVLTAVVRAALDSLARNWVSGIYLSGLSSGPKIVKVISLILVILLQCCCPLPPCKHDHKLFGPHTFFIYCGCVFFTAADVLWQVTLHYVVSLYCCTGFQRHTYPAVAICYCICEKGKRCRQHTCISNLYVILFMSVLLSIFIIALISAV